MCSEQLSVWAKEWNASYLVCSDQLQLRTWSDDGWLDWLPSSLLGAIQNNATMDSLREAVRLSATSGSKVSYSDAVRFLLLYKFGGIYIDADVLLLRNMEPFSHYEFVHEWSWTEDINTAIMGSRRQSAFTAHMIQAAMSKAVGISSTGRVSFNLGQFNDHLYPLGLFTRLPAELAKQVHVLPSMLFDPIWLVADMQHVQDSALQWASGLRTWDDVFQPAVSNVYLPADIRDICRGAYAFHWHNRWDKPFVASSVMGLLSRSYGGFFSRSSPDAEGKLFSCS